MYSNLERSSANLNEKNDRLEFSDSELSLLQKRIAKNVQDSIREICSSEFIDESNTVILKMDIERATADNFKIFNDFVNSECKFDGKNYILDMSKALFMDSTFLGCIVVFYKKIYKSGGTFKMIIDKEKIKILSPFEQLAKILNVFPSVNTALVSSDD